MVVRPFQELLVFTLVMGLAAFLGLFLGFVYSTFAEYLDHSFSGQNDVESKLGVRLLASIPEIQVQSLMRTHFARAGFARLQHDGSPPGDAMWILAPPAAGFDH